MSICDFLLTFEIMGDFWPFSSATKWEHLFSRVLRLWTRSLLQIVYLSWLLDKPTIF